MLELCRTVRMCIGEPGSSGGGVGAPPEMTRRSNTYSAWPAMRGLGRYYELDVCCRGEADAATGYFINIKHIDTAVREHVLDYLQDLVSGASGTGGATVALGETMRGIVTRLAMPLDDTVERIRLHLTPRYSLEIRSDTMDRVTIRQQYEFAAAHRLHVPEMSDEENRETFGKCNNPAGHGHNYRVEVAVGAPIDPAGDVFAVEELDDAVADAVIDKLDHQHLNHDIPQFAELNPSVENIAKVIWEMLIDQLDHLGAMEGVILEEVRVWETEKTVCVYRGEKGT